MRAKLQVIGVTQQKSGETVMSENLSLSAVCGKAPFGENGESEDNTYARYTPMATLTMQISNPNLFGKIKEGQKFYLDFTEASD
jgi:hypothetical protein